MEDDVRPLSATEVREYIQILDREIEMLTSQRREHVDVNRLDLACDRKLEIHTLERARAWFVALTRRPVSWSPEVSE